MGREGGGGGGGGGGWGCAGGVLVVGWWWDGDIRSGFDIYIYTRNTRALKRALSFSLGIPCVGLDLRMLIFRLRWPPIKIARFKAARAWNWDSLLEGAGTCI